MAAMVGRPGSLRSNVVTPLGMARLACGSRVTQTIVTCMPTACSAPLMATTTRATARSSSVWTNIATDLGSAPVTITDRCDSAAARAPGAAGRLAAAGTSGVEGSIRKS